MDEVYRQLSELKKMNNKLKKDMSERDLLEEKLRSSENKVRAIFEAMTDIVLIIHADGNVLSNVEIIPTKYSNSDSDIDLIEETVEQFFQEQAKLTWLEKVSQALKLVKTIHYDYSLVVEETKYWFSASISPICETQVVWGRARYQRAQASRRSTSTIRITGAAKSTRIRKNPCRVKTDSSTIIAF